MADITQADADALIAEQKEITGVLVWTARGVGYRLRDVVVLAESGTMLRLTGYVGRKNRSFALLYRNTPIRRYTAHDQHKNPDGELISGPHEHLWDDIFEDSIAYVPEDIRMGDPNDELIDFLAECNMTIRSGYQRQNFFS